MSKIPPLGIRILPHLEKSEINLNLIDDASSVDIAPWTATPRLSSSHSLTSNHGQTNIYQNCGSLSGMSSREINYIKYFQYLYNVLFVLGQTEKKKLC